MEYATSRSAFCGGVCHIMDEPYASWKASKHHAANSAEGAQAECIECHFLPGGHGSFKGKMEGLRHLAAFLYDPDAPMPIRPVIKDGACLRSGCHDNGEFEDKKIAFTEKTTFTHKAHFGDKVLGNQALACDDCHLKVTAEKHFEVPEEVCFLCHLYPAPPSQGHTASAPGTFAPWNEAAAKCDLCHTIPTKSLQSQLTGDDPNKKPITHQTLEKAGVACESCHFQIIKGLGQVDRGQVSSNGCLACHNPRPDLFDKIADGALMHDKHVATRRADCFDCHAIIEHRDRPEHLDIALAECVLCHQDPHRFQKTMLAGTPVGDSIPETPHLMSAVNTGCVGCHLQDNLSKGHAVKRGSAQACADCHTEGHKKMLADWEATVEREVRSLAEVEEEARQALADAEGKVPDEDLREARALYQRGIEFKTTVEIGNGVHNKKYAILLIDEAFASFEDLIDLLEVGG